MKTVRYLKLCGSMGLGWKERKERKKEKGEKKGGVFGPGCGETVRELLESQHAAQDKSNFLPAVASVSSFPAPSC